MYTPKKTASYEGLVAQMSLAAMAGRDVVAGPVRVDIDIRLQIPASWSNKKKLGAAASKVAATKKPDIDNVEKAIFDGMNGVVWVDDVQVVEVTKRKRYSNKPGVSILIYELDCDVA